MDISAQDILTVAGAVPIIIILVGVLKTAMPTFDSARFGPVLSISLGVLLIGLANATALADVRLDWVTAVITGIMAGASAAGVYDAGKGLTGSSHTETAPVMDETTGGTP